MCCAVILAALSRMGRLFYFVLIIYPIIVYFLTPNDLYNITLFGINISADFNTANNLVAGAFYIVATACNVYFVSVRKKFPIIIGSIHLALAVGCLYTQDLLNFFVLFELMSLTTCMLLVNSNTNSEPLALAKIYFITHFISASLILLSIIMIFNETHNTSIVHAKDVMQSMPIISMLLLVSSMINIAAVPFSFWMLNCYTQVSSANFIYLFTFSSKLALLLFIKLFYGMEVLKYIGIITAISCSIRACFENNLRRIFCYYNISQLGVLLIIASTFELEVPFNFISLTANHIITNALVAFIVVILLDSKGIDNCCDIKRIKGGIFKVCLIFTSMIFLNLPFTTNFIYKTTILKHAGYDIEFISYIIMCVHFFNILSIPIRKYYTSKTYIEIKPNQLQMLSLFTMILAILIINIHVGFNIIHVLSTKKVLTQALLVLASMICVLYIPLKRFNQRRLVNFSIVPFLKGINTFNIKPIKVPLLLQSIISRTGRLFYNQQISISIVFTLLSISILVLN